MHMVPSGWHGPQVSPQNVGTSLTQIESHDAWQQKGSAMQICPTQALQLGSSASPSVHWSCGHGFPPQMPPLQSLLQQSWLFTQPEPGGRQGSLQTLPLQKPVQHWLPAMQMAPFGEQGVMQAPPAQVPLQHSPLF